MTEATAEDHDGGLSTRAGREGGHAPSDAELIRRQALHAIRYVVRPRAYLGAARELALSAVHVATYPLGLLPRAVREAADADADERMEWDRLDQRPAALAAHTRLPVIVVHGYVHNHSAFLMMVRALRRAGFRHLVGFNYNPLRRDLDAIAVDLDAEVDRVLAATGATRCLLVGHSMGGIVARAFVQRGGSDRVDTVVTIGSPHRGTYTAYLGPGAASAQLRPGSRFLRGLEETARPSDVRWVAYYSDLDLLVTPAVNAKLVHPALAATNIKIRDTGHLSLLLSRDVIRGVVEHLVDPDFHRAHSADQAVPRAGSHAHRSRHLRAVPPRAASAQN